MPLRETGEMGLVPGGGGENPVAVRMGGDMVGGFDIVRTERSNARPLFVVWEVLLRALQGHAQLSAFSLEDGGGEGRVRGRW